MPRVHFDKSRQPLNMLFEIGNDTVSSVPLRNRVCLFRRIWCITSEAFPERIFFNTKGQSYTPPRVSIGPDFFETDYYFFVGLRSTDIQPESNLIIKKIVFAPKKEGFHLQIKRFRNIIRNPSLLNTILGCLISSCEKNERWGQAVCTVSWIELRSLKTGRNRKKVIIFLAFYKVNCCQRCYFFPIRTLYL